jgi:hypothetical protein
MAIHLKHVLKLAETLFDSGACLVVLRGFHCSQRGDVRTAGVDFSEALLHQELKIPFYRKSLVPRMRQPVLISPPARRKNRCAGKDSRFRFSKTSNHTV